MGNDLDVFCVECRAQFISAKGNTYWLCSSCGSHSLMQRFELESAGVTSGSSFAVYDTIKGKKMVAISADRAFYKVCVASYCMPSNIITADVSGDSLISWWTDE